MLGGLIGGNLLPRLVKNPQIFGSPGWGGSFYGPFEIVRWHFKIDFSGAKKALIITYIVMGIGAALPSVFLILLSRQGKKKKTKENIHGASRWMKKREVKKSGMLEAGGVILGQTREAKFQREVVLGEEKWKLEKPGKLLFSNSPEHVLIVAPTRRGKGINNVIPTLLNWTDSCVVYDIKKENWEKTAGWRKQFSHVLRFEPTSESSVCFNPLMEVRKGPKEVPDVQNIVEMISDPFGEAKKDHWSITGAALLVGVILHVLYTFEEKSLYGVYRALNNPGKPISVLLQEMLLTKHLGNRPHPTIAEVARNCLNKMPKGTASQELSSIVSTASSYLSLYQDPIIARTTANSDFTIDSLMDADHPISLYLVVSPQDADRLRPLTRMVISMIGKRLTGEGIRKRNHRLLFLIDEFPSLGKLEFFETQLAFFAGYGVKCMIIIQSFSQLHKHYTKETSISSNCRVKVFLGADSPEEAKNISDFLGKETVSQTNITRSGQSASMFLSGLSEASSQTGRSLLTEDEVYRLPFDEVIVCQGGTYPYNAKKIMYWGDPKFSHRAELSAPDDPVDQKAYLPPRRFIHPWLKMKKYKEKVEKNETSATGINSPTGAFADAALVTVPEERMKEIREKMKTKFKKLEAPREASNNRKKPIVTVPRDTIKEPVKTLKLFESKGIIQEKAVKLFS